MILKYVMFGVTPEGGKQICVPFLSIQTIKHSDLHESTRHLLRFKYRANIELVSAGFVDYKHGRTYGEAESLDNLKAREEDWAIIDHPVAFNMELDKLYNWR